MKNQIGLITLVTLAVACGPKQQNPVKNYSNLPTVTPYQEDVKLQNFAVCGVTIDTAPTLVVAEGQKASQEVVIRGIQPKSNVTLGNAPDGVRLERVKSKESTFALIAEGKSTLIEAGKDYAAYQVEIIPPSQDIALDCSEKVGIVVTRSKDVPVVSSKIQGPKTIDLSSAKEDRSLTIKVVARGTIDPLNLTIVKSFDFTTSTKENPTLDISQSLRQTSAPTLVAADTYEIKFEIDPDILRLIIQDELPAGFTKTEIESGFSVSVYNADTGKKSPEQNVMINLTLPKADEKGKRK